MSIKPNFNLLLALTDVHVGDVRFTGNQKHVDAFNDGAIPTTWRDGWHSIYSPHWNQIVPVVNPKGARFGYDIAYNAAAPLNKGDVHIPTVTGLILRHRVGDYLDYALFEALDQINPERGEYSGWRELNRAEYRSFDLHFSAELVRRKLPRSYELSDEAVLYLDQWGINYTFDRPYFMYLYYREAMALLQYLGWTVQPSELKLITLWEWN